MFEKMPTGDFLSKSPIFLLYKLALTLPSNFETKSNSYQCKTSLKLLYVILSESIKMKQTKVK